MPDRQFLLQPIDGVLHVTTYAQAVDQARRMATALLGLGLSSGDKVALLAKNSAEWVLADLAIAMAGLISVPIYPTANANTIAYIIGHSEAKAIIVGKLDDPDALSKAIPKTMPSIAFPYDTLECQYDWQQLIDSSEPITTLHEPDKEDTMTILYTSGSTGQPKGVVLSYRAYTYGCSAAISFRSLSTEDRALSYLPLAHIVERGCVVGPCLFSGCSIYFTESLETFSHDLITARPTGFASVPRLWVKFQFGILDKIPSGRLRVLLAIPIVGRIVARKIKKGMGLDQCETFSSGR